MADAEAKSADLASISMIEKAAIDEVNTVFDRDKEYQIEYSNCSWGFGQANFYSGKVSALPDLIMSGISVVLFVKTGMLIILCIQGKFGQD